MTMGHIQAGSAYLTKGDLPPAIEQFQKAIELTTDPMFTGYAGFSLSFAYLASGRFDESEQAARSVVENGLRLGMEAEVTYAEMVLGALSIFRGDLAGGMSQLEDLTRRLLQAGRKPLYAFTEHLIGSVYLQAALGESDAALAAAENAADHLNRAIEVAHEIGAKGTLGDACLDLGRLHKAKGRKDQARECIPRAIDLFEQCEIEAKAKQAREVLDSLG
jgi:tetratricopeptide (TPR) repeat protein